MSDKSFKVSIVNGELVRNGRPQFINLIVENMLVEKWQDRRHVLHGATQITDVLMGSFNRFLRRRGALKLESRLDKALRRFKRRGINFNLSEEPTLLEKARKVIIIAFSNEQNLVVGSKVANQGIEKARESIHSILRGLESYYGDGARGFAEMQAKALAMIASKLRTRATGEISKYRKWIMNLLHEAVNNIHKTSTLFKLLADFEFSCTLDIVHDGTTREQNIWGLEMAGRLQEAVMLEDEKAIWEILL